MDGLKPGSDLGGQKKILERRLKAGLSPGCWLKISFVPIASTSSEYRHRWIQLVLYCAGL